MALIITDVPANVPTPSDGDVTPFFNADANNQLYYKRDDDSIYPAVGTAEDCCCEITKSIMKGVTCALESGMISMTDFSSFIAGGMVVSGESTDDGAGNKTCTVTISNPVAP